MTAKGRPPKDPYDKASVTKSVRFTPSEWGRFEQVRIARSLGSVSTLVMFWLERDERDELSQRKSLTNDGAHPDPADQQLAIMQTPCPGCFADRGERCEGLLDGAFHELRLAMAQHARAHPDDDLGDPVVQEAIFERFAKTADPDDVTFEADPDRVFATERRRQDAAALELLRTHARDPAELAGAAGVTEAQARASINRLFLAGKLAMRKDNRYYAVGSAAGHKQKLKKAATKKRRKASPPAPHLRSEKRETRPDEAYPLSYGLSLEPAQGVAPARHAPLCPVCAAEKGQPCTVTRGAEAGKRMKGFHRMRQQLLAREEAA